MAIRVTTDILNQNGCPAFYSDIFANRPAAGFVGRIFISINDNVDAKIYMNYYLLNKISNIKNYETDINYLKYLIILKDSNNNYMKKIYNLFDKYSFPNEYNAISFYKYKHFY